MASINGIDSVFWLANTGSTGLATSANRFEYISQYDISAADKSQPTFTDLQNGTVKDFTLAVTAQVDISTGGLWKKAYDSASSNQRLDIEIAPYGNATPSTTQPHIKITNAYLDGKPLLTAVANKTDKATVVLSFLCSDYQVITA